MANGPTSSVDWGDGLNFHEPKILTMRRSGVDLVKYYPFIWRMIRSIIFVFYILFLSSCSFLDTKPPELTWPPAIDDQMDFLSDQINGKYVWECKDVYDHGEFCKYEGWIEIIDAFGENPRYVANYSQQEVVSSYPDVILRAGPEINQKGRIDVVFDAEGNIQRKPTWDSRKNKYVNGVYWIDIEIELKGLPGHETYIVVVYDSYNHELNTIYEHMTMVHRPTETADLWRLRKKQ